jgi:acetamidase/formamidase
VKGFFCREYEPEQTVAPGESVSFRTFNAGWHWDPGDVQDKPEDGGHALAGPFEVRGAKAGQTLVVRIDEVTPRGWGETWGDGERFEWALEGDAWRMGSHAVRSAPFLGVIGMPPPETGLHSTGPPRRWGGNIDCKLLVAATTLYLPIPVDGALLMAGDCHGAQGDGEVSGTAIECPLERERSRSSSATSTCAGRSHGRPTHGSRSASTRTSTPQPHTRPRRCST